MSKICGCLSQEILTHPHTWEIPKRPGGEWNQIISPHTSRFDVCLKAAPHQSPSTPMTTLMSLKQGIRFSYVFTKHGQKGPRNATRSREAEKPDTSREAEKPRSTTQAEKPRSHRTSREAEKPRSHRTSREDEKPRSREATGHGEKPRSRGAAGQAEKPPEPPEPPGKPRSREATGQAEKPRSHRTS